MTVVVVAVEWASWLAFLLLVVREDVDGGHGLAGDVLGVVATPLVVAVAGGGIDPKAVTVVVVVVRMMVVVVFGGDDDRCACHSVYVSSR
jgi:hypothetical protein